MKNLYKALGFTRIVHDRTRIEANLGNPGLPQGLAEAAAFILLQPQRKLKYDQALRGAVFLGLVRRRLGRPVDPDFPPGEYEGFNLGKGEDAPSRPRPSLAVVGMILLLGILAVVISYGLRRGPSGPRSSPLEGPAEGGNTKVRTAPMDNPAAPAEAIDSARPVPVLEEMLPMPHGWIQITGPGEPKVPWSVETPPGQRFFVKLRDIRTRKIVVEVFLQGGKEFSTLIPEGEFELMYTSGTIWYGPKFQFGPGARIIKFARPFRVEQGEDGKGNWSLRLEKVTGGFEVMAAKDFEGD